MDTKLIQKFVSALYSNDEWSEQEIRETVSFIMDTNDKKNSAMTLIKLEKELQNKNLNLLLLAALTDR